MESKGAGLRVDLPSRSAQRPQPLPVRCVPGSSHPGTQKSTLPTDLSDLTRHRETPSPSQSPSTKPRDAQSPAGRTGPMKTSPEVSSQGSWDAGYRGPRTRVTVRQDLSSNHDHGRLRRAGHGRPDTRPHFSSQRKEVGLGREAAVGPGSRRWLALTDTLGRRCCGRLSPGSPPTLVGLHMAPKATLTALPAQEQMAQGWDSG